MTSRTRTSPTENLGQALISEGLISENQLRFAVQLQTESLDKKRLGEIMVELGYLTKRQLREISRKYHHRIPFGTLLVDSGLITEEQLGVALEAQQLRNQPLGEILLAEGMITEEQLALTLSRQLDFPYIVPNKRLIDRNLMKMFPESFLRDHTILPLFIDNEIVTVLLHNPLDQSTVGKLETLLSGKFDLAVAPRSHIRRVLKELLQEQYLLTPSEGATQETSGRFQRYTLETPASIEGSGDNQIINLVDYILSTGIKQRASDIHIESMYNKLRVRYRIDGRLVFETDLPTHLGERIVRRIKYLAKMDMSDNTNAVDGHFYATLDGSNIDMRVSLFPTVLGCSITIRALTREIGLKDLGDLGLLPVVLTMFRQFLDSPSGFILFAGPTGSGKTTSLYACLNYLNTSDVKICTIESPVEYSIEGIAQCQMRAASGQSSLERIRAMMHQDPDVIVIGEINDEPTAEAAVSAVLSGHKVFTTIHADDAFGALLRLMDLGLRTYLQSSTGIASVSQRLVRQICKNCNQPFTPSREVFNAFRIADSDPDSWEFFHGKGCPACNQTGFLGRAGAFEVLAVDPEIRDALLQNRHAAELRQIASKTRHYISLRESGFIKAAQGHTTLEEVLGILSYSEQQSYASMTLSEANIRQWMDSGQ